MDENLAPDDEPDDEPDDGPGAPPVVLRPALSRKVKYVPTARQREVVAMLVANQVPFHIIALSLDIGTRTLDRHYAAEIAHGRAHMVARVGLSVLRKAMKGNMNAARYWLMTHGGPEWRLNTKDATAEAAAFATPSSDTAGRKVRFYVPENGRDRPETPEPPVIEGEADVA
jgi:hypothetical protein